jgi:hypothetical protein
MLIQVPVKNNSDLPFNLDLNEFAGKLAPTLSVADKRAPLVTKSATLVTKAPYGILNAGQTKTFEFSFKQPDGKVEVIASAALAVGDDNTDNNKSSNYLSFKEDVNFDLAVNVAASMIITSAKVGSAVQYTVSNSGPQPSGPVTFNYTLGPTRLVKNFSSIKSGGVESWTEDASSLAGQTADFTITLDPAYEDKNAANNTAKLSNIKVVRWDLALGDPVAGNNGKLDANGNILIQVPVKNNSDLAFALDLKEFAGKLAPTLTIEDLPTTLVTKAPYGTLNAGQTKTFEFLIKQPDGKERVAAHAALAVGDDNTGNNKSSQFLTFKQNSNIGVTDITLDPQVGRNNDNATATVKVTLTNSGARTENNIGVKLTMAGTAITPDQTVASLDAGRTATVSFKVPMTRTVDKKSVTASLSGFNDSDSTDDSLTKDVMVPNRGVWDLAMSSIEIGDAVINDSNGTMTVSVYFKNPGSRNEPPPTIALSMGGQELGRKTAEGLTYPGRTNGVAITFALGSKAAQGKLKAMIVDYTDDVSKNNEMEVDATIPAKHTYGWDYKVGDISIPDGDPKTQSLPLTIKIAKVSGKYTSDQINLKVKVEGASDPFSATARWTNSGDYVATITVPLLQYATMRSVRVEMPDFKDDNPADNTKSVNLGWPKIPPPAYKELAISKIDAAALKDSSYYPVTVTVGNYGEETETKVHLQLTMNGKPTAPDQTQTIDSIAPGVKDVTRTFRVPGNVAGVFKARVSIVDFTDADGKVQTTDAGPLNNVATFDLTIPAGGADPYTASTVFAGTLNSASVSPGSDVKITCMGFPKQKEGEMVGVGLRNVGPNQAQSVAVTMKDAVQTLKTYFKKTDGNIFSKLRPGPAPAPDDPGFYIDLVQKIQDFKELSDAGAKFDHEEIYNEVTFTIPSDAPKARYKVFTFQQNKPGNQCQADITVQ